MAGEFLDELQAMVRSKKDADRASSYTASLFAKGANKIAQKVGEESVEVVIAALAEGKEALIYESADLLYHLMVLWEFHGVDLDEVIAELRKRQK